MIQMAVRQQHSVYVLPHCRRWTIQSFGLFTPLEHAAIHKHVALFGLNVICRAGDFAARSANNCDLHFSGLFLVVV
jgi:hypothetical protein